MKITQPKFEIGQKVYINTKRGLELQTIESILISVRKDNDQEVSYYFDISEDGYRVYSENLIIADYKSAKKKLQDN